MTSPRKLTPQEEVRLEQVRRNFQERKKLSERFNKIGNSIGVYSGKGGVGKTTVAVNLAVTLAKEGASTALFDCDIDCPNVTRIIRLTEGPRQEAGVIFPSSRFGVKVMSMAFFHEKEEEATIWRGPMIHNAINRFLSLTEWGDLDYLIVDLPPGTSDAPLTVMQTVKLDGFVVVTTPQELAVLDAKRSANMIKKMNLPVLGVFENMSGDMFGRGGGEELADDMGLPFLGRADMRSAYSSANGPAALESPEVASEYEHLAQAVVREAKVHTDRLKAT